MIGHYLSTLTPAQEDRVLQGRMAAGCEKNHEPGAGDYISRGGRCLVGTAWGAYTKNGYTEFLDDKSGGRWTGWKGVSVEERFDSLMLRFGTARVTAAIRNRILSTRARQALAAVRETVSV